MGVRQIERWSRVLGAAVAGPLWLTPALAQTEPTVADALVRPRMGVTYDTNGAPRDFGGLTGFIPLGQTPGQDLWFLQGQARLDTAGFLGSNLQLGYRTFGPDQLRLTGGYVGLDIQDYGGGSFYQLAAGVEQMWAGWELRGNAYWPVGDRASATTLSGTPFFQGNQLLLPTTRQVTMAGGDVSVGGAIATLGDLGPLHAYGGVYYYTPLDQGSFLGGRAWMTANPAEGLTLQLGVQYDQRFGPNLLLQTSFSWGGGGAGASAPAPIALGQSIQRTMGIATAADRRIETALNPDSNQVYQFYHVHPGGVAPGDGSAAAPYQSIDLALAMAGSGDRIYVQPGALTSGFTIPSGVQVLSSGPVQPLRTQLGTVALPGSGSGSRPYVPGTVVMTDDSLLSGFTLAPGPDQDGIQANGVRSVTVQNNHILAARNGILLNQVSGDVAVRRNWVQSAAQNGILLTVTEATTVETADLSHNQIGLAAGNGLLVRAADSSQINTLQLRHNHIDQAQENGLGVLVDTNSRLGTVVIDQTQIARAGANGVLVVADAGSRINQARLGQLEVGRTGSNGVLVLANDGSTVGPVGLDRITVADSQSNGVLILANAGSTLGEVAVRDTAIQAAGANGVFVAGQAGSNLAAIALNHLSVVQAGANGFLVSADQGSILQRVTLVSPRVGQASENGILLLADNGSQVGATWLEGGMIQAAAQNGVLLLANNGSRLPTLAVTRTQVGDARDSSTIAGNGLLILADQGSWIETASVTGNQLGGVSASGIQLLAAGQSQVDIAEIQNNQLQTIDGEGLLVIVDSQSQITQAVLTNNQLQTIGGVGIQAIADGEGQLSAVDITANHIRQTTGSGIQVFAANQGQIDNAQITANTLTAIGQDGIVAFAETGGQMTTASFDRNQVSLAAQDGLRLFATNGGMVEQGQITNNQTQQVGNTGVFGFADSTSRLPSLTLVGNQIQGSSNQAVELGNEGTAPLCALVRDNHSLDTANFDANLFTAGAATLQIVDLPQLNAQNNGTFTQVNNAGATAGQAGQAPCPSPGLSGP